MTALLSVSELVVAYGGVAALDGVSFELAPSSVTGVIGPNGAGKTTLIDAVSGFTAPKSGTLRFDGEFLGPFSPHERSQLGLGRTFQSLELFEDLTVAENLLAAMPLGGWCESGVASARVIAWGWLGRFVWCRWIGAGAGG